MVYMDSLYHYTNKLIYKTEIDPQTYRTNLWLQKGKGEEGYIRSLGLTHTHYSISLEGRTWQPTLVFLPGESHRQRSLLGCSPWGRKELAITE